MSAGRNAKKPWKRTSPEILDAALPHDIEAEKALAGAIVEKPGIMADVVSLGIRPSDFHDPAIRFLYGAMFDLHTQGKPVDAALLLGKLKESEGQMGIRATALVGEMVRVIQLPANWRHYADRVLEKSAQRKLQFVAETLLHDSINGKASKESAGDAIRILDEIRAGTSAAGKQLTYRRLTCAELAAAEFNTEYLVEWTLVAGQPCILAGPKKACKTTIVIDLAISLAIGGYFLGKFKVNRACRVLLMTGESGLATVQETAFRIAAAAGYQLSDIGGLIISDQLPMLGHPDHEAALRKMLVDDEIEVLILDPTYLTLNPDGDEASLFAMGTILQSISTLCAELGVTLLMVHHTRKGIADPFAPPELENIAWAGFQEFARQWLLLGRRERYEPGTGKHKLWLSVGGSAGHSALWAVDINEGEFDGITPRKWQVDVLKATEAIERAQEAKDEQKAETADKRRTAILEADRKAIVKVLVKYPNGETKNGIRDRTGIRSERVDAAIASLLEDQTLTAYTITRANHQDYDGFKINENGSDL